MSEHQRKVSGKVFTGEQGAGKLAPLRTKKVKSLRALTPDAA